MKHLSSQFYNKALLIAPLLMIGFSASAQIFTCNTDFDCPPGYTCLQHSCKKLFPISELMGKGATSHSHQNISAVCNAKASANSASLDFTENGQNL